MKREDGQALSNSRLTSIARPWPEQEPFGFMVG